MKFSTIILCLLGFGFQSCFCQSVPFVDSGVFLLHKFAQHIGEEKYKVEKTQTQEIYHIDFKFVDRGTPVPLQAVLVLQADGAPLSLQTKGRSSRFSICNDTVSLVKKFAHIRISDSSYQVPLRGPSFPVAGYSPGTVQMKMLDYWRKNGRPEKLSLLPSGSVSIRLDGLDTFQHAQRSLILERYMVSGLIWGIEWLWTNQAGQLYCMITNDAEGDKLEMLLQPFEALLPVFISRAATSSMALFARQSKTERSSSDIIFIHGGTLVDVVNKKEIPNASLIIAHGIIQSITNGEAKAPEGAVVIDASGKSILPGLWDMHAHFEQAEWGPAYLGAGVTTVRDCGNEFEYINAVQEAIERGIGTGPHILKAGIIDGNGPNALGIVRADSREEAIKFIQRYKDSGFVQIKIYSSVRPPMVRIICEEAHRLGMTVTGHVPVGMNIISAVDSGMDMINHIMYAYRAVKVNKQDNSMDLTDTANQRLLHFLKEKHTVIDPTLGIFEMIYRPLNDNMLLIEPAFYSLPVPIQTMLASTGMPQAQANAMKPVMDNLKKLVKALYDEGIPIVSGTDMEIPGWSLHRELELYVQGGLSAMEALQTATIIPARVMGKDSESGSIEQGKIADLVIVDGDPGKRISDTRKIKWILKGGKIYEPRSLRKMAGFQSE